MSVVSDAIGAGGARPLATVKVWDPFVRLFHWSLVASFVVAYATGDEIEKVHVVAGYTIAGLVTVRILWGIVGPRHARFSSFVRPPREVLAYLRDVLLLRAPRFLGHNPAGGAMIVALLAALISTCVTGYMMTTDAYWGAKWVEEVHEFVANLTVGLVVAHILGVLVASFEHRENLVASMITGRKRREAPTDKAQEAPSTVPANVCDAAAAQQRDDAMGPGRVKTQKLEASLERYSQVRLQNRMTLRCRHRGGYCGSEVHPDPALLFSCNRAPCTSLSCCLFDESVFSVSVGFLTRQRVPIRACAARQIQVLGYRASTKHC